LSSNLILLTYRGRRSGVEHTLPVQYANLTNELIVVAGQHERKRWWRNLRARSTVKIRYRGRPIECRAELIEGDEAAVTPRLAVYFRRFAHSAHHWGITFSPRGELDSQALREAAKGAVVVVIRLKGDSIG